MRNRQTTCAAAAALALAITATAASAASDLYWQGGTAAIASGNYYSAQAGTTGNAPAAGDILYIGENGVANSAANLSVGKVYVGHNSGGGAAEGLPGPGTVNVTAGTLSTTAGANGVHGLIVGNGDSASFSVDGAGVVNVNRLAAVGYGSDATKSATLNVTNGGTFKVAAGNFSLGDGPTGGTGIPGTVNVNGTLSVASTLNVGLLAGSTYSQTGGTATTGAVVVGANNADGSSYTLSAGTHTAGGNFSMATGTVENASASVTGGTLSITGAILMATGTASNTSFTISNDATVTTTGNLVLADTTSTANNTSLTLSDTAHLTIGSSVFLGRASSSGSAININGGTMSVAYHFLMGTSPTTPTGIVVNHTAGSLTTNNILLANGNVANFAINDNGGGDATYNLSGTGVLTTVARGVVGRQKGTGTMNQSGGSANFNNSLHVGDAQPQAPIDISVYGHGFYNLSGGTLAVTVPAGSTVEAFSIAPAGTATFHVFGADATMNVTGNMGVYANTNGSTAVGTLAYTLQPGESLTKINVSGTATFQAASVLAFDTGGTTPTQSSYDLITAADVVNNGLVLSAPAGWHMDLVDGATTKTLQIVQALNGDANRNGKIDADDYALIDRGAARLDKWWHNGDFNDNGVIDSQDYLLIDTALGQQNGGHFAPAFLAQRESQFGSGYVADLVTAVPEPGTLSLLAAGALPLVGRRRRQAR